ncbi:MAG: hypothetical protein ABI840_08095 [bacterium]
MFYIRFVFVSFNPLFFSTMKRKAWQNLPDAGGEKSPAGEKMAEF